MKSKPMVRIVPASQAKNNFGEVIKRVYEKEETQIIERAGLPVAVIIPVDEYIRMQPERAKQLPQVELSAKRARAAKRLRAILDEMHKGGEQFSEEEVEADVMREWQAIRHGKDNK